MTDDELERLRKQKLEELQEQANSDDQEGDEVRTRVTDEAFRKATTPDARSRWKRVEMTKPELAEQVKQQIITAYQTGQIPEITDEQMKEILSEASEQTSNEYNIRRR